MKKELSLVFVCIFVGLAVPTFGEEEPGLQTVLHQSLEHCDQTSDLIEQTISNLDSARSGEKEQMRAAIDQSIKTLGEMKNHMALCSNLLNLKTSADESQNSENQPEQKSSNSERKVKHIDPVCHMEVNPQSAISDTYNWVTYYFCSEKDRAEFHKNPEQYIKDIDSKKE